MFDVLHRRNGGGPGIAGYWNIATVSLVCSPLLHRDLDPFLSHLLGAGSSWRPGEDAREGDRSENVELFGCYGDVFFCGSGSSFASKYDPLELIFPTRCPGTPQTSLARHTAFLGRTFWTALSVGLPCARFCGHFAGVGSLRRLSWHGEHATWLIISLPWYSRREWPAHLW